AGRFVLLAWLFLFSSRRALRPLAKQGALPSDTSVRDGLTQALALQETASRLAADRDTHAPLLDEGALDRAEAIAGAVSFPVEVLQDLVRRSGAWDAARGEEAARVGEQLQSALEALQTAEVRLRERAAIPVGSAWPRDDAPGQLDALAATLALFSGNRRRFRERCLYVAAAETFRGLGHETFLERLEQEQLSPEELLPAVERNLLTRWLHATTDAEPALAQFDVTRHERLIERFRQEDRRH